VKLLFVPGLSERGARCRGRKLPNAGPGLTLAIASESFSLEVMAREITSHSTGSLRCLMPPDLLQWIKGEPKHYNFASASPSSIVLTKRRQKAKQKLRRRG
jgi:hypothetical protein